jgi:hypothetical protein
MPTFKKQTTGLIIGLVLEYLLGMYVNMYVSFPESGSESQMWEFAKTQPVLMAHILVGALLLLNSLWLLFRAFKAKDLVWKKAAGFGALGILIASFGGESFIGSQNDLFSYLMASGFILALVSYFWGLYKTK